MKYTLATLLLSAIFAHASSLRINIQNEFAGSANPFSDENGTTLQSGDLVQLGYFSLSNAPSAGGTTFDNFVSIETVVFDLGVNGSFATTVDLDSDVDTLGTPDLTLQYGLRIFNDTTEASSTFFNTVTTDDWVFSFSDAIPPPTPSEILLDPLLGTSSAIWEGGASSTFQTTVAAVAVPEPSTSAAALLGFAFLLGSRRRK